MSTATDTAAAIEQALSFCFEVLVPAQRAYWAVTQSDIIESEPSFCPHIAFIESDSISELTAKVLSRYGINVVLTPACAGNPVRHLWKLSPTDAVFIESVSDLS